MTDEMRHSLVTDIELNFANAIDDIQALEDNIDELNRKFSQISQTVQGLDLNIGKRIAEAVKGLEKGSLNIGTKQIKDKIETELTRAILSKQINFSGLDAVTSINIDLTNKDFKEKLREIRDKIVEVAKKSEVDASRLSPLKFNVSVMADLRDRFHKKLSEYINENLDFEWEEKEGGGEKKPAIRVTAEQMQALADQVRNKVIEHLSKPESIQLDNIPQLKIDAEVLKEVVKRLEESVGNLDQQLGIDVKALKDLPNIQERVQVFQNNVRNLVEQLVHLDKELNKAVTDADAEEFKKVLSKVSSLTSVFLTKVEQSVDELLANMTISPVSTDEFARISAKLDIIRVKVRESVEKYVDSLIAQVTKTFQLGVAEIDGERIYAKSIQELQKRLIEVTVQSVQEVDSSRLGFDLGELSEVVAEWSRSTTAHLKEQAEERLKELTVKLLTAQNKVLGQLVSSVDGLSFAKLLDGAEEKDKLRVQEEIHGHVDKFLKQYVHALDQAVSAFSLTAVTAEKIRKEFEKELSNLVKSQEIVFEDEDTPIQLKGVVRKVQQKLQRAIRENVEAWQPSLEPFENVLNIKALVKPVQKAVQDIIEQVLSRVKSDASQLMEGVAKEKKEVNLAEISQLLTPVNNALMRHLNRQVDHISKILSSMEVEARFNKSKLHADVRRALAQQEGMLVREWDKTPIMEGQEAIRQVMNENLRVLMRKFHNTFLEHVTVSLKDYDTALKQVELEPDLEAVHFLAKKLNDLQKQIVRKVKQVLTEQFQAMSEEIHKLTLYPISIGYKPTRKVVQETEREVARRTNSVGSRRGGFVSEWGRPMGTPVTAARSGLEITPGGDTRTFAGSVVNTMRYITAGAIMGTPFMLYSQGWQSAREFDYQMEKARQNLVIKDQSMESVARRRILNAIEAGILPEMDRETLQEAINKEAANLRWMTENGVRQVTQNIATAYALDPAVVSQAFHIATRRFDDPHEALYLTRNVAKLKRLEDELDLEAAAKGLEAIGAQWGLSGFDMDKVADMMIKTSALSQAMIEDLFETQQRAGAIFRQSLPGMTKEEGLATAFALSSMFVQATARSGNIGGTFWKTVLERPYQRKGREALQRLASIKGYEYLDPYYEDEHGNLRQKDFITVFSNILEAMRDMDDQQRKELMEAVIPQWHIGSTEAVATFIEDLQRDLRTQVEQLMKAGIIPEGDPDEVRIEDAIRAYIDQILNVDPADIDYMLAGMMSTWNYQIERMASMWKAALTDVFDSLKGEFTIVSTYVNAFLRFLHNNADDVAKTVSLLGKIGLAYGGRYAYERFQDFTEKRRVRRLQEEYGINRMALDDEGRFYNLQRLGIEEEMARLQAKRERYAPLRAELSEKMTRAQSNLLEVGSKLDLAKRQHNELIAAGADEKKLASSAKHIKNLERAYGELQQTVNSLNKDLESLDRIDARIVSSMESLQDELNSVNLSISGLQERMELLDLAYQDLGMSSDGVRSSVNYLQREMSRGKMGAVQYEEELKKMAKSANVSDKELTSLRREVELLGRQFARGKIDARQFASEIRRIERSHFQSSINSLAGKQGQGIGLLEMVIAGSLLGSQMRSKAGKGVFGRIGEFLSTKVLSRIPILKGLKSAGEVLETSKVGRYVGGILGGLKGVGDSRLGRIFKGLGGGIWKGLRGLPFLGWALLGMDVGGRVLDSVANLGLTEGERELLQAERLEKLAKRGQEIGDRSVLNPFRYFNPLLFKDAVLDGIAYLFGANVPSFMDYFRVWEASNRLSGAELQEELAGILDYQRKINEARMKMHRETLAYEDPMIDPNTGLLKETLERDSVPLDMETAEDMIQRISDRLQKAMAEIEANMNKARFDKLAKGIREDSEEMRKVMEEYFSLNIEVLDEAIEELKSRKEAAVGVGKQLLELKQLELEAQRAQLEYERQQSRFTRFDEIMAMNERRLSRSDALFSRRYYEGLLQGERETSEALRAVERERINERLQSIDTALEELRSLRKEYEVGDDRREQIDLQISQLEAERAQLRYERYMNEFAEMDDILGRLSTQTALIEAKATQERADAILRGATEESALVKAVERSRADSLVRRLTMAQEELKSMLERKLFPEGSEQWTQIWLQIQQIEAEKKTILADMRKLMGSQATFNLPSGIAPMSYFEYMTRRNTHRNVTVRAGDTIINLTIDNVSSTEHIENVAVAVENAVKKAQLSFVNAFASDVKSGMGATYLRF